MQKNLGVLEKREVWNVRSLIVPLSLCVNVRMCSKILKTVDIIKQNKSKWKETKSLIDPERSAEDGFKTMSCVRHRVLLVPADKDGVIPVVRILIGNRISLPLEG